MLPSDFNPYAVILTGWLCSYVVSLYLRSLFCVHIDFIIDLSWFLHHSDLLVPRYRQDMFIFQRGALRTLSLVASTASYMDYLTACVTHGISETHVVHHHHNKSSPCVCSWLFWFAALLSMRPQLGRCALTQLSECVFTSLLP